MMTFYSAIGSYRIKNQNGRKVPYIQRLGKLHPISIPEFVIWSTLLWEVLTYDELKRFYDSQMKLLEGEKPDFDQLLDLLVKRKLVSKGLGYTGRDALFICSQRTLPGPKQDIHQLQRTFREHSQQLQRLSTSGNVIRDNKCIRQHIVQRISASIA